MEEDKRDKLEHFKILAESIRCIGDLDYQKRVWVNHEDPNICDSYDDTTMYFLEDGEIVIDAHKEGTVEMSKEQFEVLTTLYHKVDDYDDLPDRPEEDAEIVKDPRWLEVVEYAKKVYPILSTES